jgi:hypothetical protein
LIVLCSGDAFFDEPFVITPPLLVLIVVGRNRGFVARGAWHRIPAFCFRR